MLKFNIFEGIVEVLGFDGKKNKFAGVSEMLIAFHASDVVRFSDQFNETTAGGVTRI